MKAISELLFTSVTKRVMSSGNKIDFQDSMQEKPNSIYGSAPRPVLKQT